MPKAKNTSSNANKTPKTPELKSVEKPEDKTIVDPEPDCRITPKEIDPSQYIVVRNGFQGSLVYASRRTGEIFKWESFGDEQEIELRELRNAKSSDKEFFINNWFMFNEEFEWVINYLGLTQFYRNAIKIEDFDSLFTMSPDEIDDVISKLSTGQKKSVIYSARQKVISGEIDSRKTIAALEKSLNIELIEK